MRASFSSRDVDNHTAYIRIKTNAPNEDQFIILPVEVEVTSGVLPVANSLFIFWTRLKILLDCNQNIGPNWVFFSNPVFFSCSYLGALLCSPWNILLYRDAWLWYPAITRYKVLKYEMHVLYFGQIFIGSYRLHSTSLHCLTDRPKVLNLHLLNSGTKDVPITVSIFFPGLLNCSMFVLTDI